MATDDVRRFFEDLPKETTLRADFERAMDFSAGHTKVLENIVRTAKFHGYEFTADEYEEVSEELAGKRPGGSAPERKAWWKFW